MLLGHPSYYNQPDLTAATLKDGWLDTGDLGKLDAEGNLYILGRTKNIIITGGENICPEQIEEILLRHPAVRDCVVVGCPDRLLGEVPCAFVVKANRTDCCTDAELLKFCRAGLSSHKVPRRLFFVKQLPKLGSYKPDRRTLKQTAEELYSTGR